MCKDHQPQVQEETTKTHAPKKEVIMRVVARMINNKNDWQWDRTSESN